MFLRLRLRRKPRRGQIALAAPLGIAFARIFVRLTGRTVRTAVRCRAFDRRTARTAVFAALPSAGGKGKRARKRDRQAQRTQYFFENFVLHIRFSFSGTPTAPCPRNPSIKSNPPFRRRTSARLRPAISLLTPEPIWHIIWFRRIPHCPLRPVSLPAICLRQNSRR